MNDIFAKLKVNPIPTAQGLETFATPELMERVNGLNDRISSHNQGVDSYMADHDRVARADVASAEAIELRRRLRDESCRIPAVACELIREKISLRGYMASAYTEWYNAQASKLRAAEAEATSKAESIGVLRADEPALHTAIVRHLSRGASGYVGWRPQFLDGACSSYALAGELEAASRLLTTALKGS
jgi:hypothetical protein